ncbi:MAG: hypothetical protein K2X28_04620 [Alphaproteobacteria bacterium]|nr:hypothetical protein [Alphaproteobacteria bacterium]
MKKFFFFIVLCLFALLTRGMARDVSIEIVDYDNKFISRNASLRIDFIYDAGFKAETKIPFADAVGPVISFKVGSVRNLKRLKSIAAFLYKDGNISSFSLLNDECLIRKLVKNKIVFDVSNCLSIDTSSIYPFSYDHEKENSTLCVDINGIRGRIYTGNRFYRSSDFIICRQPIVNKEAVGSSLEECSATTITEGKVYQQGEAVNFPSPRIYVADEHGNLFIGDSKMGCHHHSHILNSRSGDLEFGYGKDVSSAGHICLCNGKITSISNFSGHYTPRREQFLIFAKHLLNLDLFTFDARIQYFDNESPSGIKDISCSELRSMLVSQLNMEKYPLKKLPSFKKLLTMAYNLFANISTQASCQNISSPFYPEENPAYKFVGRSIGSISIGSIIEISDPMFQRICFMLYGRQWKAEFIDVHFLNEDLILKLLSETLYPDDVLKYEYLVGSSEGSVKGILRIILPTNHSTKLATASSSTASSSTASTASSSSSSSASSSTETPIERTSTRLHFKIGEDASICEEEKNIDELREKASSIVYAKMESLNKEISTITQDIEIVRESSDDDQSMFIGDYLVSKKKELAKLAVFANFYTGELMPSQQAIELLREEVDTKMKEIKLLAAGIEEVKKGTSGYSSAPYNEETLEHEKWELLKKKLLLSWAEGKIHEIFMPEYQKFYNEEIANLMEEIYLTRLGIEEVKKGTPGYSSAPYNEGFLRTLEDEMIELKATRLILEMWRE